MASVLALVACSSTVDGRGSGAPPPPECSVDGDCASRDTDDDVCTRFTCSSGRCVETLAEGIPECECNNKVHCIIKYQAYTEACATVACEAHKCKLVTVSPAGPSPKQRAGDCQVVTCDGTTAIETKKLDPQDVDDDNNDCTTDTCGATKTTHAAKPNATACNNNTGLCFDGKCIPCQPQNPTSCGAEGPGEPNNNSVPHLMPQDEAFCGFSSSTDVDWYTFDFKDAEFSNDVLYFKFASPAPTIEVCAYAKCNSGFPKVGGGCSSKLPGPNGSEGCCYVGAPSTLAPTWDIDCSETSDDSGKIYVSVKTPGSDACEPYIMKGGY
jgi:hypothetical protein